MVAMRDGVRLATDVYLPPRATQVPAILVRSPYDKNGSFGFWSLVAQFLNERGYAVVVQDTRGKNRSEGRPIAFDHEALDGFDTLDWLTGQAWSNGIVGMFGESYFGFTQWAAKASGHEALRAIVPRLTSTDIGRDWMYHQGVFCLETMAEWASQTWLGTPLFECQLDWAVRPLVDVIPATADGLRSESFDRWIGEGPDAAFWNSRTVFPTPSAGRSLPVLHWGGWWDIFRRGQIGDFASAASSSEFPQYLIMDSIDHLGNGLADDGVTQEDFFSSPSAIERAVPALFGVAAEFFDLHLRGLYSPIPAVRWHLANEGWRSSDQWPPPHGKELRLHLADLTRAPLGPEGGSLVPAPDSARATATWIHDPANLVPSLISDAWRPLLGLPDEREVELRDDVLTFTTDVQRQPLDLAGPVTAHLFVQGAASPAHVMAKLVDVFPTGRARRISEGACRLAASADEQLAAVDLGDVGYRLQPGHALRLEVSSSDFPRYLWDSGTGESPWYATTTAPAKRQLRSGGDSSSYLSLRVLAESGATQR